FYESGAFTSDVLDDQDRFSIHCVSRSSRILGSSERKCTAFWPASIKARVSPSAWEKTKSPNVEGVPGTASFFPGAERIRNRPLRIPPLKSCPVECRYLGPHCTSAVTPVRSVSISRKRASFVSVSRIAGRKAQRVI